MNTNDAKEYLARREIPQLFESLLTGLMYYRPDDPIEYLEGCLKKARELGGPEKVRWDTFVGQEKKSLPPLNGGQSRRSLFRNVLPDSPNFPYRRYDRLPPISQFSIESDSDLSETAELIEEYEVFDPSRPRPKVILVIGGPGSGKGTQSLKIADRYGFQYMSVGELLRKKMIHNATSNRKWSLIAKIITNGELAPQETTITEIKQKIMKIPDANGIVIDGFPRDVGQALSFEDQICTPDLVVFLACTNHRLKERLQKRAEQQGRPDDNPKAIERRLTNFKQNTIPLVKYFQERGLIVTLDADRDEEEVFCDIGMTLDNKLFPSKEPAAGPSELDLSLLGETSSLADVACKDDEVEEEEEIGYAEGNTESYSTEQKKPKVIFMMGGPGSGKALQCERMEERFGLRRVTLGDLLCSELQSNSDRGRYLRDALERGEQLPEDTLLELLCDAVVSSVRQGKGLVISGFPRDLRQAEEYEAKCRGRSGFQAAPDRESVLHRRVESFCSDTQAVAAHYEHKRLLHTIDAERSPDQVFAQICRSMESGF
ncbi:adenylate kinase isoenzyme 5 isoform X2 [Neolamprologus brichardi]|uniref:Adenylate kinase isoenzyme 5 n=1 Tax=Neolamprologus brichardi TaxID=32507 RepID=A0A3Q4HDA7_NEOBR|nr:adenylate kinase isoenzyme 5 isoform X2 [Neolamprologus brichardi]